MYSITEYTKTKAKELGLTVKPSTRKNKKIDVFKDGKFIHSIGDVRFLDYPSYLLINKKLAEERRKLYHLRHTKNTLGEQLALKLLW